MNPIDTCRSWIVAWAPDDSPSWNGYWLTKAFQWTASKICQVKDTWFLMIDCLQWWLDCSVWPWILEEISADSKQSCSTPSNTAIEFLQVAVLTQNTAIPASCSSTAIDWGEEKFGHAANISAFISHLRVYTTDLQICSIIVYATQAWSGDCSFTKSFEKLVSTCSWSLSVVHSINYMLQLTWFGFMICLSIPASADHKECAWEIMQNFDQTEARQLPLDQLQCCSIEGYSLLWVRD
jgi:hypothetical protein